MIIDNGSIRPILKQGGGFDAKTRQPIAPRIVLGDAIPCQYTYTEDRAGSDMSGNPTTGRSYVILVEGEYSSADGVRLISASGSVLVENAPVRSIEYLRAVDQTKLTL